MYFHDDFEIQVNGVIYHAHVEGELERDDYDNNVYSSMVHEYNFVDEDGKYISEDHEDFDELVNEVMSRDYHPKAWR